MFVFQQQQNLDRIFCSSKMHLSPQWLRLLFISGGDTVVVDTLFIVTLIVWGGGVVFGPCLLCST